MECQLDFVRPVRTIPPINEHTTFITVVMRSLAVLVLLFILGLILSGVGQKVIEENFHAEIDAQQATARGATEADETELEIPVEQEKVDAVPVPAAHG